MGADLQKDNAVLISLHKLFFLAIFWGVESKRRLLVVITHPLQRLLCGLIGLLSVFAQYDF